MSDHCLGEHRIFVPEVIGIPDEGRVVVVTVCTACNEVRFHEKSIAAPGSQIRLLKEEKGQTK